MNKEKIAKLFLKGELSGENFIHLTQLREDAFADDSRSVTVTVIKSGWSKNGLYYPQHVLSEIKDFLLTTAKKVYLDHNPEGLKGGRKVSEWIANVTDAWVDGKELKATIQMFEDGPHSYVYDRMRMHPEEFGPSIVGLAETKKGEWEGIKGKAANKVVYLRSFDIVADPAAGGKIDRVAEGVAYVWGTDAEFAELSEAVELKGYMDRLKEREEKYKISNQIWETTSAFSSLARDLILGENEADDIDVKTRKANLQQATVDLNKALQQIKFVVPKKKKEDKEEGEDASASAASTDAEESFKVEWITRTGTEYPTGGLTSGYVQTVSESKTETNTPEEVQEKENHVMTLDELKAKDPVAYTRIMEEARQNVQESAEITRIKSEHSALSEDKSQLTSKLEESNKKAETLEAENAKLKAELEEARKAKAETARKEMISEAIKSADLSEEAVTETFRGVLNDVSFDADKVDEYKAKLKSLCEDRKAVFSPKKKVDGAGNPNTANRKKEMVSEDVVTPATGVTNSEAARMIRSW